MKKIFLILSILLLCSCENDILGLGDGYKWVNIWLEEEIDDNNYYHIEYNGTNYHSVYFFTEPNERVYWSSPDSYTVLWQYQTFEQAIINYSTYADELGNGQQLFYLDNTQIGDTLMIFGYVPGATNMSAYDYLYFILEDNE